MQNPIRIGPVIIVLLAITLLPCLAEAQEGGHVTKATLTVSETRAHAHHRATVSAAEPSARKVERAATARNPRHKAAVAPHARIRVSRRVPRSTFEDRTARYFDPLSLTLAPDSRLDPAKTQYNQMVGKFAPADQGQVAAAPDDPTAHEISSASIENLEQGHNNVTIVVPLFRILNSLSDQPPPQQ